jgi:hypothetical protein
MKHLYKICVFCSLLVLGFVSCEQDNTGALYEDVSGVTFANAKLNSVTVQATNPTFTVDLLRGDSSSPLSGNVTFEATLPDKSSLEGVTVSGYSFGAGETKTTITVNVDPLEIGVVLSMKFTIPDNALTPVSGIGTLSVDVQKAYTWLPLGKGKYVDNWVSGVEYPVEIQKAEGFNRYRVLNPYVETLKNDDGEWEDWRATSSAPHVEFWTTENNLVSFLPFFLGLNYQADSKQPIYAYHASAFSGLSPDFSKWVDSKTVQLAPYFYIEGLGGWNNTQKNGVIIITMP